MSKSIKSAAVLVALTLAWVCPALVSAAEKTAKIAPAKVAQVKKTYEAQLAKNGFKPSDLEVYAIGKSHIDAAWKWRYSQTRDEKCPATFRNAIEHSLQYPGFSYTQSSGQYYEWVEQVDPKLFQEIVEAEKEGRWQIVGGMWVEPDGNMPEGESFVRQFLYGQRYFMEKFGHASEVCFMEDSFGYNWNLPQFAAKSGIKYMYTAKLPWNGHNIFPFHLFSWQSPDGSRVLTYISPTVLNDNLIPLKEIELYPRTDYVLSDLSVVNGRSWLGKYRQTRYLLKPGVELTANYLTSPDQIRAALSSEMMPVMVSFYGVGDGGHGPLPLEIENQLSLQELGYGKMSDSDQAFRALEKYSGRIPVWNDEMYLEYHQGVMTTHEWIKRMNRGSETLMRTAEAAAAAALLLGREYPSEKLLKTWKTILLNQFHDILPGSSIAEVYQDTAIDYAQVEKDGNEVINSSLAALAKEIDTRLPESGLEPVLVFNPLGWDRSDPVRYEIPDNQSYRVFDADGKEILSQVAATEEGGRALYFKPGSVPGLGWQTLFLKSGEACAFPGPKVKESAEAIEVDNGLVKIAIDKKTGLLLSLYDQTLKREFLKGPSNKILAFTDKTMRDPAWNLTEDYLTKPIAVPEASSVRVESQGPLFARVLVERKGKTSFKQWVTVWSGSAMVSAVTWTDMHWKDAIIKVEYNTMVKTDKVAAEIPYGVIERSTHPAVAWDKARTEMPVEKWVDLSDKNSGIALINFGKYGVSLNQDGAGFRMSIVKNAAYPTAASEAYDVKNSTKYIPDRETDPGEHWAHLALLTHSGTWREGIVNKAAYEFNTPAKVIKAAVHKGALPAAAGILSLEGQGVFIGSLKKAEDDNSLIVRVVEGAGRDSAATIKVNPAFRIESAAQTNLIELEPKPFYSDGKSVSFPIGHSEIKTIKLKLVYLGSKL